MNKNRKIILAIIIVIVLAAAAFILFKPAKSNAPAKDEATPSNSTADSSSQPVAATITYDGQTFTSSASSIKSGDFIKVVNSSDGELDFDSDPHPVHTDNPELNAGDIAAGESKTFKLTTKGTWGFHNHLNSSQHGEIQVQ